VGSPCGRFFEALSLYRNIAFHFGAMYALQILEQVVEHGSAEAAALTLSLLTTELEDFMKAHAVAVQ
jgi:hypothetical protein